jgi:hypothetical protein
MASDSLFGGGDTIDGGGGLLDAGDRALLDQLLADFAGGPAIDFDGGKLLNGTGPGGEKQGALTPGTGELQGPITNGDITMEVDIPAGLGLTFSGKDGQTPDAAEAYLNTAIGGYFKGNVDPNSDAGQQQQSLTGAVDDLLGSLGGGKDVSVRLIDFLGKSTPNGPNAQFVSPSFSAIKASGGAESETVQDTFIMANAVAVTKAPGKEIAFDAGSSKGKQVFAFNLTSLGANDTLVVSNVEAVLLGGPGAMRAAGNSPVRIQSDNKAQKITGGGGNDTLVGAGNDTLTGGAGSDLFGFTSTGKGKYVVTDFSKSTDTFGFKLTGITNFEQLKAAVTKTVQTGTDVTFDLGPDLSITLIGVTPGEINATLVKFTF